MSDDFREHSNDTIFKDAVDAMRRGDKVRAKDLLTRLLKSDQNNAKYWIWLSVAVDSPKERIYCLETALKLDPENATAKRGLILLGALAPDESIQPFPMNRPRAWEAKLLLASEQPKPKGMRAFARNPAVRLLGLLVIGAALVSAVIFGFILPRQTSTAPTQTHTPGPSPTFTTTPTRIGEIVPPTQAITGPTPLWMLLPATYTPTPLYVNTPRVPEAIDQYRIARQAYEAGDWDAFIANMRLLLPLEPNSADIHYLIGEAYRFKGQGSNAQSAYNDALRIDPNFAPAYLGRARAQLQINPRSNPIALFNDAIRLDPNYGEAYLERARFFISRGDYEDALEDLERAEELLPNSTEVYMAYASLHRAGGELESAIEAAERAYSLDITHLPVYRLMGELYLENEQYQRALEALEVYVTYETEDALALAELGQVLYELKDYDAAVSVIDRATTLNRTGLRRFLLYRGLAHLELGNADEAVSDLEEALGEDNRSFTVRFGLTRGYYAQEKFGSAFLQVEAMRTFAETDEERALTLYWRALIQEQRNEIRDAIQTWNALLALDEDVMTPQMRADALEHLKELGFSTPTPRVPTSTQTPRTTPTPTRTPTRTPTP
jgi:tetratricopeptide (TPR) repeat protein